MHNVFWNSDCLEKHRMEVLVSVEFVINHVWKILLSTLFEDRVLSQFLASRSLFGVHLNHHFQHLEHVVRKVIRNLG